MTQQEREGWEWPKKETGKEGVGIQGCLGQNVLIPNQHHRELCRDFTLFPFWGQESLSWFDLGRTATEISCPQGVEKYISVGKETPFRKTDLKKKKKKGEEYMLSVMLERRRVFESGSWHLTGDTLRERRTTFSHQMFHCWKLLANELIMAPLLRSFTVSMGRPAGTGGTLNQLLVVSENLLTAARVLVPQHHYFFWFFTRNWDFLSDGAEQWSLSNIVSFFIV